MTNKLTVIDVPEFMEESAEYDKKYRRTAKWDVEKGDFVRDGANRIVECSGEEGFMIWCYKTTLTERYCCRAYSIDIGVEQETALAEDKHEIVESMVERTITDALKINPRTEFVNGFEFTWNADEMHVTFLVKGVEWDKLFRISI